MERTGSSGRRSARRADRYSLILAAFVFGLATPAGAQRAARISLPATTLDHALTLLGRQAGVDIASLDPGLSRIRTPAVAGPLSPAAALRQLLRGSGYRAVPVDAHSFRVVRDIALVRRVPPPQSAKPAPRPTTPRPAISSGDIIVTASKQRVSLLRYPGSLSAVGPAMPPGAAPQDLGTLARVSPILQTTGFGPGRDKVFIRGIADSSFVGATQSTASVYFGDVQLGFSGADPAIRLYDMARVEVLEGPQGTLYGAGAIGGVIHLTPNPVELNHLGGSLSAGTTLTRGGRPGADLAATLNLPLAPGVAGIRGTLYRVRDGGYVDDVYRGATNVNAVDTQGGRLALRIVPGGDWTVDLGGLYQSIRAADAQYAERRVGDLARRSGLAQPYDNNIALGSVGITRHFDSGLEFVSVTGLATASANDLFDASRRQAGAGAAIIYHTQRDKRLFSHEMRLSRHGEGGGSWVVGLTLLDNRDSQNRTFGFVAAPIEIIGVTNRTRSASLFGEASLAIRPDLTVTLGLRATQARTDGDPSFRPRSQNFIAGQLTRRVDPTVAFSWKMAPELALFGRMQTGFRTGGLAVARMIGRVADFRPDAIALAELGIRRLRQGPTGLALTATLSQARWRDIQADLVTRRGLPYTANIGDARIGAVEGTADWVPIPGFNATLSFLYTGNRVRGALADTSLRNNRRLPDTPPIAASGSLRYEWAAGAQGRLGVAAIASYVGRSVLGAGDLFDITQGRYGVANASAWWTHGRTTVTLSVDNALDTTGNRFASGNPLILSARDQTTPLRPVSARLGVAMAF